jgi:hypothetical protein
MFDGFSGCHQRSRNLSSELSMNRLFSPDDPSVGRIYDQLARLAEIRKGRSPAFGSAQQLTREQLSELIDVAFWASLQANEGRTTRVCVTVAARENFPDAIAFTTPVRYRESDIAKLAPAVPPRGCLVVSASSDGFWIWGFGRYRPGPWVFTVTIEVSEPGTVRVGVGPFQSYAILNGRSNPIIAGSQDDLAHYLQRVLHKASPADDILETHAVWQECLALTDLARMILADGHGGTVLIVPGETGVWLESLSSFPYQFAAPETTIRDAIRLQLNETDAQGKMLERLSKMDVPDDIKNLVPLPLYRPGDIERAVRATASLAGVDGAVVMTRDLRILGFGAKIAVGNGKAPRVCMFPAVPGKQDEVQLLSLEDLGGTRHQSAARFTAANKDAVAIVVSQDRHMKVMHWHEPVDAIAVVRDAEWRV